MKTDIKSKRLLLDDFFAVEEAWLRFEKFDGEMSDPVRALSIDRGDAVAAVLIDTSGESVVLVKQFRYPTLRSGGGWLLELVAGMLGPNEQPDDAIRREILEETGYAVADVSRIATFFLSPGGSSERIHLFLARIDPSVEPAQGGGCPGENEDIEIVELAVDEAAALVDSGEIADAKTIVGLQWLLIHGPRAHRNQMT